MRNFVALEVSAWSMPYRGDEEAWVRRSEAAEARAQAAEVSLRELASMKANAPWRQAGVALVLVALGVAVGWNLAPPEHRPGSFTALSTAALAARSRARYSWRAKPQDTSPFAAQGEACELSVDAQDNDGVSDRPVREIYVRLACGGRTIFRSSQSGFGERRVSGCVLETGEHAELFCSIGARWRGRFVRLSVDTRSGFMRLATEEMSTPFQVTPLEHLYTDSERVVSRGASWFESAATITHVSGIPSDGPLARPRVRAGAECYVMASSSDGARRSECEVEIDCGGTRFQASGACSLDDMGQIERVVDLTLSSSDESRNASIIFDVMERQLLLMDDNGYEAFLVQLSLESSRSRARFL